MALPAALVVALAVVAVAALVAALVVATDVVAAAVVAAAVVTALVVTPVAAGVAVALSPQATSNIAINKVVTPHALNLKLFPIISSYTIYDSRL